MATHDVPGANVANKDVLAAGCWAEHDDGSLIYVKGTERNQVIYEIFDVAQDPPIYYQDAMRKEAFEKQFSYPSGPEKWTWHDKTNFPWNRVMKTFERPKPEYADIHDTLSAAKRVAESLRLRGQKLSEKELGERTEQIRRKGRGIIERIERAVNAFMEE